MTKIVELSDEDAAQVHSILMTHAEMQDGRALEGESVIGRLSRDEPEVAADTINDLHDSNDVLIEDCDNLKRIAALFE